MKIEFASLAAGATAILLTSALAFSSADVRAQEHAASVFAPIPSLVPIDTPPVPLELARRAAPYTNFRDAHIQSWSPTGHELLLQSRFGDVPSIHLLKMPLGMRQQLTFSKEPAREALWQPVRGEYFVYMTDLDGAENFQLARQDLKGGAPELITDGVSRNMYAVFAHDGSQLAWASNSRSGGDLDLWVADPAKPATRHLVAQWKGGGLQPQDWSPDGKTIAVLDYLSVSHSSVELVDAASGQVRALTAPLDGGTSVSWADARFTPDGKALLVLSDRESEYHRLWRVPLEGGKPECLTPAISQDIDTFELSKDGTVLAFSSNEEGISRLHLMDYRTGKALPAPTLPVGEVRDLHFHPKTNELAFSLSTPTLPFDIYSLKPGSQSLTRWTESEKGNVDLSGEKPAELIHWKAKDGVRLSGFLFAPPAKFTGKRPVILDIHGGPEGQSTPQYLGNYHYFVNEMGAALIYPNVRGSSGFGKTYASLDNGVKREDSVTDIGALLDWIATRPDLDASRVLVAGMSYGGYMTLSTATQYNDRIVASIDTVGLSSIITFLEHTSAYRRDLRRAEYGDERDPQTREALAKIAPLALAGNVTKPMFILAGQMDPRVPYSESLQIAKAVKANGTPVWFLGMKDEGHVFQKKSNIDYGFYLKILFAEKYLMPSGK